MGGNENGTVKGAGKALSAIRLWPAASTLRSRGIIIAPPESTPNVSISRLEIAMVPPLDQLTGDRRKERFGTPFDTPFDAERPIPLWPNGPPQVWGCTPVLTSWFSGRQRERCRA